MLREGRILHVPITQDGQDEMVTVVVDQVVESKGGARCHLSGEHGGFWLPTSVVQWAIAQAEVHLERSNFALASD